VDTDQQSEKDWLLNIQRKLYAWSQAHPEEAWRDMWNWIIHPHNLRLAWQRVASNRGARTAGVDGVTVHQVRHGLGVQRFLDELRQALQKGSYRPQPVRRILIPKQGKPGQTRPLGVPTVADRVVQAAVLNLLEPIYEADFYPVSYGFRPKRACRDALEHIRDAIRLYRVRGQIQPHPPYQYVIEGDIQACFDQIDHHGVMIRIRKRIGDIKVCRLIRAFLKAGILSEEGFWRSEAGTPQGGIITPPTQ
jgi:RNA-directed DNA polymerase